MQLIRRQIQQGHALSPRETAAPGLDHARFANALVAANVRGGHGADSRIADRRAIVPWSR